MYLGTIFGFASSGLLFGPLIGGVFTDHVTWRLCYYINLPLGVITATILLFIRIPDAKTITATKPTWKEAIIRLDLAGFVLFLPPVLMLLLALGWGGADYSWKSPTIIGLFSGSGVSFIIFLFWERSRGNEAMLPLPMLRKLVVACAALTTLLSTATQFTAMFYLPTWFQVVKGASPTMSGVYSFASVGPTIVGSLLAGALSKYLTSHSDCDELGVNCRLATKIGYYTPFSILGCALGAIGSGLLGTLVPSSPAAHWAVYAAISGFGRGMGMQQTITAVQAVLPKKDLPVGNSVVLFSQTLGGTLFISFAQTMFVNQLRPELAKWAPEVDADAVLRVGATRFKEVVPIESITGVVMAYNNAVRIVFCELGPFPLDCMMPANEYSLGCWRVGCCFLHLLWPWVDKLEGEEREAG